MMKMAKRKPSRIDWKDNKPLIIKYKTDNEWEGFRIVLERDKRILTIKVVRYRPDGDHVAIVARVDETAESSCGESANKVEVDAFCGTNSSYDKFCLNLKFKVGDDEDEEKVFKWTGSELYHHTKDDQQRKL